MTLSTPSSTAVRKRRCASAGEGRSPPILSRLRAVRGSRAPAAGRSPRRRSRAGRRSGGSRAARRSRRRAWPGSAAPSRRAGGGRRRRRAASESAHGSARVGIGEEQHRAARPHRCLGSPARRTQAPSGRARRSRQAAPIRARGARSGTGRSSRARPRARPRAPPDRGARPPRNAQREGEPLAQVVDGRDSSPARTAGGSTSRAAARGLRAAAAPYRRPSTRSARARARRSDAGSR